MLSVCISGRRKATDSGLRVGVWVGAGSETVSLCVFICAIKMGGAAQEGIIVCTIQHLVTLGLCMCVRKHAY